MKKRPYQHHYGRQSMDEYISMLPPSIKRVAIQRRTKEWAFWHVHSIPQAIYRLIDKDNMSDQELKFWDQVYYHYLGRGDLPSLVNVDSFLDKIPDIEDLHIPENATHTEKVRAVFRNSKEAMTCEQVHKALVRSGHSVDLPSIRYIVSSYLLGNNEVTKTSKKYHRQKFYRWKST